VAALELVLDGVHVVWAGLLEKPLEVVHRRPHRMLAVARIDRDESYTGATRLPVRVIVADGHGCGPLEVLFSPLATAFDVGRRLLVTARGRLLASLCRAKHDRLVSSSTLGGDALRLLKCAPEGVCMSTLPRALHAALRKHALATLVSLAVSMGLTASILPPWQCLG
jgi:hypothetical protein